MKTFYDSFYVGATTTSFLVLASVTSQICGGERCSYCFNDWKTLGVLSCVGSLIGSYYVRKIN